MKDLPTKIDPSGPPPEGTPNWTHMKVGVDMVLLQCDAEASMLGNPNAEELMMIIAATGLAQNFAALRSLVTTGIQRGHMKMHLMNILNHLRASQEEKEKAIRNFKDKAVTFTAVREFLGREGKTSQMIHSNQEQERGG